MRSFICFEEFICPEESTYFEESTYVEESTCLEESTYFEESTCFESCVEESCFEGPVCAEEHALRYTLPEGNFFATRAFVSVETTP